MATAVGMSSSGQLPFALPASARDDVLSRFRTNNPNSKIRPCDEKNCLIVQLGVDHFQHLNVTQVFDDEDEDYVYCSAAPMVVYDCLGQEQALFLNAHFGEKLGMLSRAAEVVYALQTEARREGLNHVLMRLEDLDLKNVKDFLLGKGGAAKGLAHSLIERASAFPRAEDLPKSD